MRHSVRISTLVVTQVFVGKYQQQVVTGGENGQTWVASFADPLEARLFVDWQKRNFATVAGERPAAAGDYP